MLMHLVRDVALSLYMQYIATVADEDPEDTDLFGDMVSSILLDAGIEEGIPSEQLMSAFETFESAELEEGLIAELAVDLMIAEGLLELDTHVRIPAVLKKLIAFAVAEPSGLEINYEDPRDEDMAYLGAAD